MTSSQGTTTMDRLTVTMKPLPQETRVLLMAGRHELMRGILGPVAASHPRAVATFLEGLSLWHEQALSVVLCAGDTGSSCATRMYDGLGYGAKTVHYEVEVVYPVRPRRGRRISGFGDFGELRQLCLEGVSP